MKFGSAPVFGALSLGVAGLDGCAAFWRPGAPSRRRELSLTTLARVRAGRRLDRSEPCTRFDVLVKTVEALKWETLAVGALASVPARALPAVPMATPVDPILTAIERDRIAYVAFAASLNKTDGRKAAQEKGRKSHKPMRTLTKSPAASALIELNPWLSFPGEHVKYLPARHWRELMLSRPCQAACMGWTIVRPAKRRQSPYS